MTDPTHASFDDIDWSKKSLPEMVWKAAGSPEGQKEFWGVVVTRVLTPSRAPDAATTFLLDLIKKVEDATDPDVRAVKGIGAIHTPGAFIYSRCRDFVGGRGILPPWKP